MIGEMTPLEQARVQALPVEQLEDLSEALLDFSTAADLETWLAMYPNPTPQPNA
ncbi:DUF4351 domain-containing protein [Halochromatium roseum]|uniref:DUF4351 domain-containing protein n=1 Tax=Halochromatium roseum TaxID=391920 RepID=UPI001913799E|nr:DUF4351 domain-containing protein [Halochromatium roseum]MBK5941176.1 hypothetical protein [Halochromatium roseum]